MKAFALTDGCHASSPRAAACAAAAAGPDGVGRTCRITPEQETTTAALGEGSYSSLGLSRRCMFWLDPVALRQRRRDPVQDSVHDLLRVLAVEVRVLCSDPLNQL